MNYNNFKKYVGEMSSSDLCDAIVEAKTMDIPEVRTATNMLVDDLRDSILSSDELYYLVSKFTRMPHINEHFSVFVFDDRYYAEKFVENNSILGLEIASANNVDFEKTFSYFYDCGAEGVDFCNDSSSVMFGLEHYFLSDNYDKNKNGARMFSRFTALLMQEIRNVDKKYDRKTEIVLLLKKNVIAEALTNFVYVPVQEVVDPKHGKQVHITTMQSTDGKVFFPVYTSISEFNPNELPGLQLSKAGIAEYVEFIYGRAQQDPDVYGINVNPGSINFSMNVDIMKNILDNKK